MRHRFAPVCALTASLLFDFGALAQPKAGAPAKGAAPTKGAAPAAPAAPAAAPPAPAAPAAAPAAPVVDEAKAKEEARKYFEKGLVLFDEESWDGALAEFLRSREIYQGRSATKNAAICLRKLKRYDEALDMFETLLKMPGLSPGDKDIADRELAALRTLVGTIDIRGAEPGANIIVDGRNRGTAPVSALRIPVGTHAVRVYKEGFDPFETRVDVAGSESKLIQVKLAALKLSGRLKVVEKGGQALDVVLDGTVVGKTPWEAQLAPGDHTVLLRGQGDIGTQPATAPVRVNQTTPLTLAAEPLTASLRVQPTPAGASIALDGVNVASGLWEGRLRAGPHKLEVASEGYLPRVQQLTLGSGKVEVIAPTLDRDPNSPIWTENRGRFFVEVDGAFGLVPSFGGDLATTCTGTCAKGLGLGVLAMGRGGYRFRGGFVLGIEAGYLFLRSATTGRATSITPVGLKPDPGKADDTLTLGGALVGGAAGFRLGTRFPLLFRLGAGAFLGSIKDHRTGSFTTVERTVSGTVKPAKAYTVDATESPSMTSLYIAPEVRVGLRLGEHFELSLGAEAMVLIAFNPPAWAEKDKIVGAGTDGQGTFPTQTLTSKAVLVVVPGLGVKYDF
jgi:hypothetical protein